MMILDSIPFMGLPVLIYHKYEFSGNGWFAQSTIRANSQDDSRRMIRVTGDDSRNSIDVSRKQAAMLCFFQIKI